MVHTRAVATLLILILGATPSLASNEYASGFWGTEFELKTIADGAKAYVVDGDDLYVGGNFEWVGNLRVNHIARWDGSKWHPVGLGAPGPVQALTLHNGQVAAALTESVQTWNGEYWERLGEALDPHVNDVASHGSYLYVATRQSTYPVLRWDGLSWAPVGQDGFHGDASSLLVHDDTLYVGGYLRTDKRASTGWNSVFRLVGNDWLALGDLRGQVFDVVANDAAIFAVGSVLSFDSGLAMFDGASWSSPWDSDPSRNVYRATIHRQHLVIDYSWRINGVEHLGLAAWDGTWVALQPSRPHWPVLLDGMGQYHSSLPIRYLGRRSVGLWNNGEASVLVAPGGAGLAGYASAVTTFEGDLVVAGEFGSAGSTIVDNVARWDGARWSAMGHIEGRVQALQEHDGVLYAAGDFDDTVSGRAAPVLAWNGTAWQPSMTLDSQVGSASQLHVTDQGLIASGFVWEGPGVVYRGASFLDGTQWIPISDGMPGGRTRFTTLDGQFVVLGRHSSQAPLEVVRWTGTNWEPFAHANGIQSARSFLGINGSLYVSGLVNDSVTGKPASVVVWQDRQWRSVGDRFHDSTDLVRSGNRLVASAYRDGVFTFQNGRWLPIPHSGKVTDATEWNGDLILVGDFARMGGTSSVGIARWTFLDSTTTGTMNQRVPGARIVRTSPNPFNPHTRFLLSTTVSGPAELTIVDARGRSVWKHEWTHLDPGEHALDWTGVDIQGRPVASGVYRAVLRASGTVDSQAVTVVR